MAVLRSSACGRPMNYFGTVILQAGVHVSAYARICVSHILLRQLISPVFIDSSRIRRLIGVAEAQFAGDEAARRIAGTCRGMPKSRRGG